MSATYGSAPIVVRRQPFSVMSRSARDITLNVMIR